MSRPADLARQVDIAAAAARRAQADLEDLLHNRRPEGGVPAALLRLVDRDLVDTATRLRSIRRPSLSRIRERRVHAALPGPVTLARLDQRPPDPGLPDDHRVRLVAINSDVGGVITRLRDVAAQLPPPRDAPAARRRDRGRPTAAEAIDAAIALLETAESMLRNELAGIHILGPRLAPDPGE
jgi:hypothetical protein